jgi:hypothetical protein
MINAKVYHLNSNLCHLFQSSTERYKKVGVVGVAQVVDGDENQASPIGIEMC